MAGPWVLEALRELRDSLRGGRNVARAAHAVRMLGAELGVLSIDREMPVLGAGASKSHSDGECPSANEILDYANRLNLFREPPIEVSSSRCARIVSTTGLGIKEAPALLR